MTAAVSLLPQRDQEALRAQQREALTRQVQAVVAGGRPTSAPWGTGIAALDAATAQIGTLSAGIALLVGLLFLLNVV